MNNEKLLNFLDDRELITHFLLYKDSGLSENTSKILELFFNRLMETIKKYHYNKELTYAEIKWLKYLNKKWSLSEINELVKNNVIKEAFAIRNYLKIFIFEKGEDWFNFQENITLELENPINIINHIPKIIAYFTTENNETKKINWIGFLLEDWSIWFEQEWHFSELSLYINKAIDNWAEKVVNKSDLERIRIDKKLIIYYKKS